MAKHLVANKQDYADTAFLERRKDPQVHSVVPDEQEGSAKNNAPAISEIRIERTREQAHHHLSPRARSGRSIGKKGEKIES